MYAHSAPRLSWFSRIENGTAGSPTLVLRKISRKAGEDVPLILDAPECPQCHRDERHAGARAASQGDKEGAGGQAVARRHEMNPELRARALVVIYYQYFEACIEQLLSALLFTAPPVMKTTVKLLVAVFLPGQTMINWAWKKPLGSLSNLGIACIKLLPANDKLVREN
ncbi:hypothetical protein BD779DRAFT_1474680 [Infundibulicybe gibba]|nr:hypothetical protein BD779DRAFT_1474680 [Infundibulicybe gibba]